MHLKYYLAAYAHLGMNTLYCFLFGPNGIWKNSRALLATNYISMMW